VGSGVGLALRPLQALLAAPSLLFLAVLAVMLFRPPDLSLFHIDRVLFVLLIVVVLLRSFLQHQPILFVSSATWPMIGLLVLALGSALTQPFNAQTWSLLASKFLVPFTLFHVAGVAFAGEREQRYFETFALMVLAYLSVTAIASLLGITSLVFPRYILDESIGIHADRARGPLLQAVANGVTLNLLGILALHSYRRGRLRGLVAFMILTALPVAILATMTRAVWLSFAGSVLLLLLLGRGRRLRRACWCLICAGAFAVLAALSSSQSPLVLQDRLQERSPVEFRMTIYEVSWEMIGEKPLLGWGQNQMPPQIARRMSDYRPETYCAHSSYLEILVEQGLIGLALYGWLVVCLVRLGAKRMQSSNPVNRVLDREFHRLWPVFLSVYFVNAVFVVMNYQFVNALLFTIAGILSAQNRRLPGSPNVVT
jgi:O-antigen ligase